MRRALLVISAVMVCWSCQKESAQIDDSFYLRSGGADMPVRVKGNTTSGKMLVIVHGGPGSNSLIYTISPGVKDLERNHLVVYWDQRNGSNSKGQGKLSELTPKEIASDLNKLLFLLSDRYGTSLDLFLLSHSWGSIPSIYFLADINKNHKVKGWINVDGVLDYSKVYSNGVSMMLKEGQRMMNQGYKVEEWTPILDFCRSVDTNNLSILEKYQINQYSFKIELERLVIEINQQTVYGDQLKEYNYFSPIDHLSANVSGNIASAWINAQVSGLDLSHKLSKIKTPTRLLWGKYDFTVPPVQAIEALNNIGDPNADLFFFLHSGHNPYATQPGNFTARVEEFLEEN